MMIVMKAFAEREQSDQVVIAALVFNVETAAAKSVGYGIDAESRVIKQHSAQHITVDKHLQG